MTKEEFLKECIEYRVRKKELTLWIILLLFFEIISLPLLFLEAKESVVLPIFILLCIVPVIVYYIIKIRNIRKYFNDYVYYEVVLDKVQNSFFRSRVYFVVSINNDGKNKKYDTRRMFSTSIMDFIYYPLEDYNNKKMLVAYNPKLEEVVLVKKIRKNI